MKDKKAIIAIAAVVTVGVIFLIAYFASVCVPENGYDWGWGSFSFGGQAKLRNTIEIPMSDIDNLEVSYKSKNLKIYRGDDEKVVIKEYLNKSEKEDLATLSISNGTACVTGGRPNLDFNLGFNFDERIEIYIPEKGIKNIKVSSKSGNISTESPYAGSYDNLVVESGSGNISWSNVQTINATVATTSGNIKVEDIMGVVDVGAGSGNIKVTSFNGNGKIETHSGNVKVEADELTGNIQVKSGSGNVKLGLPDNTAGHIELETGSGNINTDFDDCLSYNKKGNQADGEIGAEPVNRIAVSTKSGNIHIIKN